MLEFSSPLTPHVQLAKQQIALLVQQIANLDGLKAHYQAIIAATAPPVAIEAPAPVRQRRPYGAFRAAVIAALKKVGKVGATVDALTADIEQQLGSPVSRSHVASELKQLETKGRARRSGKLWAARA